MTQSFVVREIILSRQKHIAYLKKILAKTTSHDAEIIILKEIHDKKQDLEYFENSESFK